MDLLDAISEGMTDADDRDGRIFGFVYGSVVDVSDPKGLGRVRARFGAMESGVSSDWLDPLWMGSMEGIPQVGDPCLVSFIDGDPHRGVYAIHAESKTKKRPTEAMVLGSTFMRMYADLVDKFNNLKSKYNSLITSYNGHTHAVVNVQAGAATITSAVPSSLGTSDGDADAAKGLAADGSTPSALATASKVLSGTAKVR